MSNYRVKIRLNDQSARIEENITTVGGTNIRALKGPDEPILIRPKQEKSLIQIFGQPSASYNDIWNVIEYNRDYPIYVCSATKGGKHGGILVTKDGTEAFNGGALSIVDDFSFSSIPNFEALGTGDGSSTEFTDTIADFDNYKALSINFYVDGELVEVTSVDAGLTETLTISSGIYSGSGTYTKATGEINFIFDTAPATGVNIETYYETDRSDDCYFIIYNPYREADDTAVKVTYDSTNDIWTINSYEKNSDGTYTEFVDSPVKVSLTEGSKDGFGVNNYIEDVLKDNHIIRAQVNASATVTTFDDDTDEVDLEGGERGTYDATTGYDYFKIEDKYPVDIFFDASGSADVVTLFDTLSASYQKYKTYLLAMPQESTEDALTTITSYSIDNKFLKFYWNRFEIRNTYTDGSFIASPMGRVAYNHAKNFDNFFGGRQVSWINENGVGGQLGSGFIRAIYNPTLVSGGGVESLENARINPIVFHRVYGVMITSDNTSQIATSDYSRGGHVGVANYIVKAIRDDVLPFQIDKPNDPAHRSKVRGQAELVISGPLAIEGILNWAFVKCDSENNDATVREKEQFKLDVGVQFTPSSKTITFTFSNYGQTTTIEEAQA